LGRDRRFRENEGSGEWGGERGGGRRMASSGPSVPLFQDRPPLKWETVNLVRRGNAVVEIQKARGDDGRVRYSWRLSRQGREKTVAFLFPDQGADAVAAISESLTWIAEAESAPAQAKAAEGGGK